MVSHVQRDVENGKIMRCYQVYQRHDRKPLDKKESIQCSGKIYSEEHRWKFDIKNDILGLRNIRWIVVAYADHKPTTHSTMV